MYDRLATPIADADPLCRLGCAALGRAYRDRSLSPVEVARACLDRAEAVQGRCNGFTRIDHAAALASAKSAEQRWMRGAPWSPLDGVPATVKDIVAVEGWPVRYGSPSTPDRPCAADAPAVARLRAAGLTLLGQTATPEFGWKAVTDSPLSGITRNPWTPAMTPGGSSGGAAVAAATGAGVLHLGTDGGGSIRVPCSFTGIVGLKPTYGRVPAYPPSAFGTLAHLGPMARRPADVRAMLAAMSGRDAEDWLQGVGQLPPLDDAPAAFAGAKIGFWSAPPCGALDPDVAAGIDAAVRALERLGAAVEPVELPGDGLLELFNVLWFSGAAARAARLAPDARAKLDPGLSAVVAAGEAVSAVDYVAATGARAEFGRSMDALLDRYDLLASPATAIPAFAAGHEVPPGSGLTRWTEWAGFSFPVNLSQQPAVSLPCGTTPAGLPIGLQFVGGRGRDASVMAYAEAFERNFPEHFL